MSLTVTMRQGFALILLLVSVAAEGTNRVVLPCPAGTFATIQAAVNAASAGDTIIVCAGTYAELVTVNKSLTLLGAQTGVDARSVSRTGLSSTESVLTGSAGTTSFNVTANNVTIDGFTIQGATNSIQYGFAVVLGAGTSGAHIVNNIIKDSIAGLSAANAPAGNPLLIQRNVFQNNNAAGPISGTAIYTDQFNAGGAMANVVIDSNRFSGNANVAVLFGSSEPAAPATNVTISNNAMTSNGNAVFGTNLISARIFGNTIQTHAGSDIVVGDGDSSVAITSNTFLNGTRALRLLNLNGGADAVGVTFTQNAITSYTTGVTIENYTGTLNVSCNWWGNPTGPTTAANPGGTGASITGAGAFAFKPLLATADGVCSLRGDLNGDVKGDIVLRNYTTGQNAVWLMNGTSFSSIIDLPALANLSYRIEGTADFNRDGRPDILLRNYASGQNAVWLMNGTTVTTIVDLPGLTNTQFHFEGTADFDRDGNPDIILRNYTTGQDAVWLMDQTTLRTIVDLPTLANTSYKIESSGDFNGDGRTDIVLRNYTTGQDALWLLNGTTLSGVIDLPTLANVDFRFDGVSDFNVDGKPDIVLRNYTTGQNALWIMNGTTLSSVVDLPAVGGTTLEINGPR